MDVSTRRSLLQSACKVAGIATAATPARWNILSAGVRKTDIRLEHVAISYEEYKYRTPIKFGGHVVDRATVSNGSTVPRSTPAPARWRRITA